MKDAPQDLVHNESLLDLLAKQQTHGDPGVRLSFHQDLMTPLSFFFSPLHYAAATGNTELVCYLYSEAGGPFANGKNITVASFSAGGRNGQTKWRVPVSVTPSQVASLAGHANTAKALKYFESGIPLHWDRSLHNRFEVNEFKLKSRELMKALLESDWYYVLPGPLRLRLTDNLMSHLSRVHVWNFLDERIWERDWETLLGEEMFRAIQQYNTFLPERSSRSRGRHLPPQYQFSVGQVNAQHRRRSRTRSVLRLICRTLTGGVLWFAQKRNQRAQSFVFTVGMFIFGEQLKWMPIILAWALGQLGGDSATDAAAADDDP